MALTHSIDITGIKTISGNGLVYELGEETITTNPLYIKVVGVSGNKQKLMASVTLTSGQSGPALAVKHYEFPLDLDGPNPIKQAYEHLKSLPEFADAVDC